MGPNTPLLCEHGWSGQEDGSEVTFRDVALRRSITMSSFHIQITLGTHLLYSKKV